MSNTFSPPANLDVGQRSLLCLDYRKITIFTVTLPLALGSVVLWRDGPFYLRGALGALIAFGGLALAFGQIDGQVPEGWLWELLAYWRRRRFMLHRAIPGADGRRVALAEDEKPETKAVARLDLPDFFLLTADAIGAAALTGLTLWLYQDGAHRLALLWGSLTQLAGA